MLVFYFSLIALFDACALWLQLAQKLRLASDKLQVLQTEEADARAAAIFAIAGMDAAPERYAHVPFEELLTMKPDSQPRPASSEGGLRFDLTPAQVEIQKLEE